MQSSWKGGFEGRLLYNRFEVDSSSINVRGDNLASDKEVQEATSASEVKKAAPRNLIPNGRRMARVGR